MRKLMRKFFQDLDSQQQDIIRRSFHCTQLQWESENRTCPVFGWLTLGRFSNGLGQPKSFYIKTFFSFYIKSSRLSPPFLFIFSIRKLDFKMSSFRMFPGFFNGRFTDPHCIYVQRHALKKLYIKSIKCWRFLFYTEIIFPL